MMLDSKNSKNETWMQDLWEWADKYNISKKKLPRKKEKLLTMRHLDLTMIYFGLNKIPSEEWPREFTLLSKEEKQIFVKKLTKKGVLPDELGKLLTLESLCISHTIVERLPDNIVSLTRLKKLSLCHNRNLLLSFAQKVWIWELQKQGCEIECDEHLDLNI